MHHYSKSLLLKKAIDCEDQVTLVCKLYVCFKNNDTIKKYRFLL